jgi:hypothetical protein
MVKICLSYPLLSCNFRMIIDKMRLAKLRSEWEPSMIAEVLQTTFKDMKSSLLYEAYDAIISMGTLYLFFIVLICLKL